MQAGSAVGADGAIAAGGGRWAKAMAGGLRARSGSRPTCASKAAAPVLALANASKPAISVMDRAMAWLERRCREPGRGAMGGRRHRRRRRRAGRAVEEGRDLPSRPWPDRGVVGQFELELLGHGEQVSGESLAAQRGLVALRGGEQHFRAELAGLR
jgi:hypothetical protein